MIEWKPFRFGGSLGPQAYEAMVGPLIGTILAEEDGWHWYLTDWPLNGERPKHAIISGWSSTAMGAKSAVRRAVESTVTLIQRDLHRRTRVGARGA